MNITYIILSLLKYQKHRILNTPKYQCTQRLKMFLQNTPPPFMAEKERKQMLKFLQWHLCGVFNYLFAVQYLFKKVKVFVDSQNGLPYVITKERQRLYFKHNQTLKYVRGYYNDLCKEQDKHSPHNYCFDTLNITQNTILVDVGAAEANFSLKFIDQIKKLYIFESNSEWVEALKATFNPWKEKIEIVNKYVSDGNIKSIEVENDAISLDDFFENKEKPTLIKMDVEDAEKQVLAGAKKLLAGNNASELLVCTYHRHGDEQVLSKILCENGYIVKPSKGYMWFTAEYANLCSNEIPIDLRKGVIHASK